MESAIVKEEGISHCKGLPIGKDGVVQLSDSKLRQAQEAQQAAISILEDVLKKKDRLLLREDSIKNLVKSTTHVICRYATVTEKDVQEILTIMKKIKFKENINKPKTFAYVYPRDVTFTVYLCSAFWRASDKLCQDSRPGTLIHEVSHFLGTKDLTYRKEVLYISDGGVVIDRQHVADQTDSPGKVSKVKKDMKGKPAVELMAPALDQEWGLMNANSLEYEFELTLRHKENYDHGRYKCCGEPKVHSVCIKSVPEIHKLKPVKRPKKKWVLPEEKEEVTSASLTSISDGAEVYPNCAEEEEDTFILLLLPPGLDHLLDQDSVHSD